MDIKYWISNTRQEDDKLKESFIKKLLGILDVRFEVENWAYSEYTSGTDYNTIFDIGGHSLYSELVSEQDKYLLLEVETVKEKKRK